MSGAFPDEWLSIEVGGLNCFNSKTINPAQFEDSVFELYSVPSFANHEPEIVRGKEIGSTKQEVEPGDVLICKINPRINRVWQIMPQSEYRQIASSEWIAVRSPELHSGFLRHYFASPEFRELICDGVTGVGGSLTRAQPKRVATFPVPIAPFNEQKRIADKLDTLLARVDACRERLDRMPLLLKSFRQAVLAAATSGQLTEEWRMINPGLIETRAIADKLQSAHEAAGGHRRGNAAPPTEGVHDLTTDRFPAGWQLLELRELVQPDRPITYGILKPGPELEIGVPYIRVADFPNDKLSLGTIRKTSSKIDEEFSRSRLKAGDILLSIRGTVGRLIVIPLELEGANITQDSARLSIQPHVSRDYVLLYLRSDLAQKRMKRAEKGVAVRGINIGDVRALQIAIPSLEEQKEIVRRVGILFAFADRLEARYNAVHSQVEDLTSALLAKAFRGELIPQDPNDEPASALLERIRTAQALAEEIGAKRRKRKVPAKSKTKSKAEVIMLNRKDIQPSHLSTILKTRGPLTAENLWSSSQLEIDDFYDQLKDEEANGLLKETKKDDPGTQRLLEAA